MRPHERLDLKGRTLAATGCLLVLCACQFETGQAKTEPAAVPYPVPTQEDEIRAAIRRVAGWQLAHLRGDPREWTNAVFLVGLTAAYDATGDPEYLAEVTRIAEAQNWLPGPRLRHADDHVIAQTYVELARLHDEPRMAEPFRKVIEQMMAEPAGWPKRHQPIDYWWADALFMSPPAVAKLATVTRDSRYLDFLDRKWREAHDLLYDPEERLFYRDSRYLSGRPDAFDDVDGKVFWSRANGWVLAGLALLLDELPEERDSRAFYLAVFTQMASRIAALQAADGLWRTDLLATASGAPGESSGSALFCYALSWGVNHGVLHRETYLPAIRRAWSGLHRNIDGEGRLGWVQRPASEPGKVSRRDTAPYGAGAWLLAASQVIELD